MAWLWDSWEDYVYWCHPVALSGTTEELREAYRQKVALWHPDKLDSAAPELCAIATARMQQLNEAYDSLLQERLKGTASEG